ncbi:uncharacterized protein RHOBADRAFT_52581 [Rhodotorula graminis WP1]|uniref:Importin N-terminal domain-containing protein n=1 Tax=Rhodotorula graminis (strain WP1) TaxID=578459 RepID=A0A194S7R0_RHOGW|nr:uncharacterized protein RHOBADRAFT_52581 [Rhodotorula graminis WP1]KPV76594.1 hypothetical protein RHOBADRAFT_52581 [Rhodotorula graminis WP1]
MTSNQLLHLLQATLDADVNTRVSAELALAKAQQSSETALGLARIATAQEVDVPWRQAACFALKKYVKEFWSPFFPSFKGPTATTPEIKAQVRDVLFVGLSDPVRKIRLACANIVSLIAQPDWPEDWSTLLDQLLALIRSSSIEAVEGGMCALSDFVSISLTEDQLLPVAREMLPTLLSILGAAHTYGPATRARAVHIFRQSVMTLFTVKDEFPDAVKAAVVDTLPQWLGAFEQILGVDVASDLASDAGWDNIAVRTAIFQALEIILNSFPSTLKGTLATYLSLASAHLSSLFPIYTAASLSNSSDFTLPTSQTGEEDSDISSDLGTFVSTVVDFLAQAVRRKAVRSLFIEGPRPTPALVDMLAKAIEFAKMTTDDEDSWATDPNAFVADEDDEMMSYNVRSASLDLVQSFVETLSGPSLVALQSAFQAVASSADRLRAQGDEDWWKGYESALAVVGAISEDLIEHVQEASEEGRAPDFALEGVFQGVVMTYLTAADLPFLQGRAFVFASQFSEVLPQHLAKQYIDAANHVLELAAASVPVKVSAVRALTNFFRHLKENVEPAQAATALSKLLPLLSGATENTLVLVLDAIQSSLKAGGSVLDEQTTRALVKTVLEVWFAKPEDPLLGSAISDSGLDIVTTVIRKDVDQLLNWRSSSGQSGLELVLAQVAKLLQPSENESAGLFVGDLVIHLVRKAGSSIGPVLPDLLQAFVTRLATAQTAMFTQSLVLPFAYLIHQQLENVLSLLESLAVPSGAGQPGRPALEVLLSAWCDYAGDFQGFWNQKVSSVALSQLYAASAARETLQHVQVKGDLVVTEANANRIMTRSRARANPDQFQPIPFPAKVLKLLLHDAQTAAQSSQAKNAPDDAVSDDEDDEWADEGAEFTAGNERDLDFLSEMLSSGGLNRYMQGGDDDEEDELDEQDLHDDPIWQLDLSAHLSGFFRHAYEADQTSFRQLAETFLNEEEKGVLSHVLQSA